MSSRKTTSLAAIWGERLRTRRTDAGLTQVEVAEAIGAAQHTISRIEHGRHRPTDHNKIALARFFETTVEELFPYDITAIGAK